MRGLMRRSTPCWLMPAAPAMCSALSSEGLGGASLWPATLSYNAVALMIAGTTTPATSATSDNTYMQTSIHKLIKIKGMAMNEAIWVVEIDGNPFPLRIHQGSQEAELCLQAGRFSILKVENTPYVFL